MPKLTKPLIDRTTATGRDVVLWDSSLPGFGVRIKTSGRRSFIVQYRNRHGRSRRMTLGLYGVLTLNEAREDARQVLARSKCGHDPRQRAVEDRRTMTVADLAERYMRDHCEGRCKESTIAAHRWLLDRRILPAFGRMSISELRQADVDQLHQSLRATPYNANRAVGLIRAMYGRAEVWGLVPPGSNPAAAIVKFRERKRQRFLSREELERLSVALDTAEATRTISPQVAGAFRLLILTGARHNEIRTLRWDYVDRERGLLLLPEHKTDMHGSKAIPLNRPALEVLDEIPRVPGNPYVVAGATPGRPAVNLQKPWRRIRRMAELEDVRIHDLRHTFASFSVAMGTSLPVLGGLLGHRSVAATATYAHLSQDPMRDASERLGEDLRAAVGRSRRVSPRSR